MRKRKASEYIVFFTFVTIVSVLAAVAYFFPGTFEFSAPISSKLELRSVKSEIMDSKGESHSVITKFALEFNGSSRGKYKSTEIESIIADAMAGLSYDRLLEDGSVEYIKEKVRESLHSYVSEEDIKGLYIRDMSSGSQHFAISDAVVSPDEEKRNSILDSFGK